MSPQERAGATERASAQDVDALIAEADAASVDGWDFGWIDGRATEQRPTWRFSELLARRIAVVPSLLDLETGGGCLLYTSPSPRD